MNNISLETRIDRLKEKLDAFALSADHEFSLEAVSPTEIRRLQQIDGFPQDMLLILRRIGAMKNWGYLGCAQIDWWLPCKIDQAIKADRSQYCVREDNFSNGPDLLFFATDCDAKVYFYNTKMTPWIVVCADGLSLSLVNEGNSLCKNRGQWAKEFEPFQTWNEGSDAISIIENWAKVAYGIAPKQI
jgi:hypothetical protein